MVENILYLALQIAAIYFIFEWIIIEVDFDKVDAARKSNVIFNFAICLILVFIIGVLNNGKLDGPIFGFLSLNGYLISETFSDYIDDKKKIVSIVACICIIFIFYTWFQSFSNALSLIL